MTIYTNESSQNHCLYPLEGSLITNGLHFAKLLKETGLQIINVITLHMAFIKLSTKCHHISTSMVSHMFHNKLYFFVVQTIVLRQVEKVKEDMFTKLYSSIRLALLFATSCIETKTRVNRTNFPFIPSPKYGG